MRRWLALLLTALTFAFGPPAVAQESTPATEAPLLTGAEVGLPELSVKLTDAGFEAPREVAAGRYLVTADNASAELSAAAFLLIPDGWTIADVNAHLDAIRAALGGGSEEGAADGASPAAMTLPPAEDPLAWLYEVTLAGGVAVNPGATAQGIVDLTPGSWALWDDALLLPAVALAVTGDPTASPSAVTEPQASVTVTEVDTVEGFAFRVDGTLAAGRQIVKIENLSTQLHFLEISRSPVPLTMDQLMQLFSIEPGMPVPAGLPDPEEIALIVYAAVHSSGTVQWLVVDLEPGTHFLVCLVPDPTRGGVPHAFEGMLQIVEVA